MCPGTNWPCIRENVARTEKKHNEKNIGIPDQKVKANNGSADVSISTLSLFSAVASVAEIA